MKRKSWSRGAVEVSRLLISQAYIYFRKENARQALRFRQPKGKSIKFMAIVLNVGGSPGSQLLGTPCRGGATNSVGRTLSGSELMLFFFFGF